MTLDIIECATCRGSGCVPQIVAGDRGCKGLSGFHVVCPDCDGVGFTREDETKLRPQEVAA